MPGRLYTATFSEQAETVAVDFFEITAPAAMSVVIHAVYIGQSSEAGDAADEQLPILMVTGHTTSGSGGASPTPTRLNPGNAAASATVESTNTTQASAGSGVNIWADCFNVRAGWVWLPPPEYRITIGGSDIFVVRLGAAPADSVTWSGTIVFEELG